MDLKNKRKYYVNVDSDTTSERVLALLDNLESDEEDKIDNLMKDSDTKFIMEKEIGEEKNETGSNDGGDLLVLDTNVHIVSAKNGEADTKKAKKRKGKQKRKYPSFTWKKRANSHERKECTLKAEVIIEEMQEHCTPFDLFWKITDLHELINLTVVQSNLYAQQNGHQFQTNAKEMMAFLGINYIMSTNYQLFKVIGKEYETP